MGGALPCCLSWGGGLFRPLERPAIPAPGFAGLHLLEASVRSAYMQLVCICPPRVTLCPVCIAFIFSNSVGSSLISNIFLCIAELSNCKSRPLATASAVSPTPVPAKPATRTTCEASKSAAAVHPRRAPAPSRLSRAPPGAARHAWFFVHLHCGARAGTNVSRPAHITHYVYHDFWLIVN